MVIENIRIVLINTKKSGNIGSVARAMKTMGLNQLYLVQPKVFPSEEANSFATGACDVLEASVVVQTLQESISDCSYVIGASARRRGISLPILTPEICAKKAILKSKDYQVAFVFGREDRGLTNDELMLCHHQVQIPTVQNFSSLNLAASVQIIAYEIRKHVMRLGDQERLSEDKTTPLASINDMEYFYHHLESFLTKIDFLTNTNTLKMMAKLRRLYNKARLDTVEMNILRGILTKSEKTIELIKNKNNSQRTDLNIE